MKARLIGAAIGAVIVAVSFAAALPAQDVRVVVYRGELATLRGQKAVLARFDHVAGRACVAGNTPQEIVDRRTCRAELVGQLVRNMDHPGVSALLDGSSVLASAR